MQAIWKFPFDVNDRVDLELPANARILTARADGEAGIGHANLWAIVDPSETERVTRTLRVYGTGHPFDLEGRGTYIATMFDSELVWHVFEDLGQ